MAEGADHSARVARYSPKRHSTYATVCGHRPRGMNDLRTPFVMVDESGHTSP